MDRFGWPDAFLVCAGVTLGLALLWTLLASDYPPELVESNRPDRALPLPSSPAASSAVQLPPAITLAPPEEKLIPSASIPYPSRTYAPGWGSLLRSRSLLCLTVSYGLAGYFQYLFFYWVQYYFETVQGLPKETGRSYSTYLSLAMGAGMVVGGLLADLAHHWLGARRGVAVVPILGLLGSAVAVVLGLMTPDAQTVRTWFSLAMAGVGMSEGSYWTVAVRLGGLRAGAAAGILNTGGNVGGLLAPILTPIISEHLGWQAGLGAASVVCLGAALLWLAAHPDHPVEEVAASKEVQA
jgi:MFS family permease